VLIEFRNLSCSLKEIEAHSHWVWSVKYNNFHDQLILSGGSDCAVNLHNAVSVSSRPIGRSKDTESDEYYLDSSDDDESFQK
jgi:EARP and GARP complex-interacting protein 1